AAGLPARALDEAPLPQQAHQLGYIGDRQSLGRADLRDRCGGVRIAGHPEQAPQAVFFLRAQFHGVPLKPPAAPPRRPPRSPLGSKPIPGAHIIPSCSFAPSLIRLGSHGGSQTSSSRASVTPSTARVLASTSTGSSPATGQLGAVSVIRTSTRPS